MRKILYNFLHLFQKVKKKTVMNQCNDIWSDNKFDATVSGFTRSTTTTIIFTEYKNNSEQIGIHETKGLKSKSFQNWKFYKLKLSAVIKTSHLHTSYNFFQILQHLETKRKDHSYILLYHAVVNPLFSTSLLSYGSRVVFSFEFDEVGTSLFSTPSSFLTRYLQFSSSSHLSFLNLRLVFNSSIDILSDNFLLLLFFVLLLFVCLLFCALFWSYFKPPTSFQQSLVIPSRHPSSIFFGKCHNNFSPFYLLLNLWFWFWWTLNWNVGFVT